MNRAALAVEIETLLGIARRAGDAILAIYHGDHAVEYKADDSPLTAADRVSHSIIVAGLQQACPDIPILSEEGADISYAERCRWHRLWLVDPLDGTKEFIKKNGEFTVNIALIEAGRPVLGVVLVPARRTVYFGGIKVGAWRQDEGGKPLRIQVRAADEVAGLTVVMSRSHPAPELAGYLKAIKVAQAMPVGSSLKLCVVAEGQADLYPRLGPTMEWDIAAGHAVVEAAGGTVTTLDGEALVYNKENLRNPHFIVSGQKESVHGA